MEGVTILKTIEGIGMDPMIITLIIICLMGLVGFIGIIVMRKISEDNPALSFSIGIGFILFLTFLTIVHLNVLKLPTNTQYEVYVDDSVDMKEFTEHYKVVDTRGNTFVVEELK